MSKGILTRWILLIVVLLLGGVWVVREISASKMELAAAREKNHDLEIRLKGFETMEGKNGQFLVLLNALTEISKINKKAGQGYLDLEAPEVALKLLELVDRYRDDHLELSLLLGVIEVESNFNPKATSHGTANGKTYDLAFGLMQVLESSAAPYLQLMNQPRATATLYNSGVNLEIGARILVDEHRSWVAKGLEDPADYHLTIDSYFWGDRWVSESLSGTSSNRTTFASLSYWNSVRQAQMRWRGKGF